MATFTLLNCKHYMRARRSGVRAGQAEWCWKCALTRVIDEVHTSDFRMICKDCRYGRRLSSPRAAYGTADKHYQDTGHQTVVIAAHPDIPAGAILLTSWDQKGAQQLELPIPF